MKPYRPLKVPRRRTGSAIFLLVMCVLIILGILGFALYRSLTEKANFVNSHTNAAKLDFAAQEMEAVIFDEIGKELKVPTSNLFKDLSQTATNTVELKISGFSNLWDKKFSFLGKKEFARLSWSALVKFVGFSGLTGTGKWNDPMEKLCRISVELDLSIGRFAARKLRKIYHFSRPCKIQRLALPIVSKFTLFVKNPEKTQGMADGYNCFENMHDGKPTQSNYSSTQKSLPLVFFNSPKIKNTDITKSGYIFLGGNDDLELRTSAGSHPEYGESFLFYSMGKPISSTVVFDLNKLPATPAFSNSLVELSKAPPLKGRLGIRVAAFGFFAVNTLGENMNYSDTLARWFNPSNNLSMNSSSLHLFGSLGNPAPTMVIGKVWRTYARYSRLVTRLEGRSDVQGLCWLKNPAPMQTTSGQKVAFWNQVTFPGTFLDRRTGRSYQLASETLSMPSLFGDPGDPSGAWNSYLEMASGLFLEEYNRVNDYLLRKDEDKDFPPSQKVFEGMFGPYIQTGDKFKLSRADPDIELFLGDLNQITTDDLIKDRISRQVKDRREFDEWFKGQDGVYDLRGQTIHVKNGPFELPGGVTFSSSGVIAVSGEIVIRGGVKCKDKVLLSLVSIGKDISLSGTNEEIQAHLVALDGTVKSLSKSPLKIRGGIAAKTFSPKDWQNGGEVTYDDRLDPTQPQQVAVYVANIADYHDRWNVEQTLK